MRDTLSIHRANLLHPKVRQEVIDAISEVEAFWPVGTCVRIVQGLRTIAEQDALYAQGRTKPGPIVTKAKGGSSFHNFGLAIDGVIMVGKDIVWDHPLWPEVVAAFKAKGWGWGGDFKSIVDKPHLEKTFGKKPAQLREMGGTYPALPA